MLIGIPKEIKNNESRVAITPSGVQILKEHGHSVAIENHAGFGSGFSNDEYRKAGAVIKQSAADVWQADLILKVKEPVPEEYGYFKEGQILFTYLHLAPNPSLTEALIEKGVTAIAYETMTHNNTRPLLTPMSEVAGRMATQIGAQFLEKQNGGKGILLSAVPGVERGRVTIIGGGVAGTNAAKIAIGLGAKITILDVNPKRLAELDDLFNNQVQTLISDSYHIEKAVKEADLVIGAVLIPGAKAPKLVPEKLVRQMKPGSVLVDVAIDQGGIFETSDRITTHDEPIYIKHGVIHYAVANMPGAVPRTSTFALTNVTIPCALQLAASGVEKAALANKTIRTGINTYKHHLTIAPVAAEQQKNYTDFYELVS